MQTTPFELVRPFLLMAVIAFLVGFAATLAFNGGNAVAEGHQSLRAEIVSAPASDDWNLPKHI